MRPRRVLPNIILASVLLLIAHLIAAADVGRIKGTVTDSKTGDPLFGVSVQIEGVTMGARTGFDGDFLIISVPPGTYNLLFTCPGYESLRIVDVEVKTDTTTRINLQMEPAILETGKVVEVHATKKAIEFLETGTKTVKKPDHQLPPIATLPDLLRHEAGATVDAEGELHIRGAQSKTSCYILNGVNFNEPSSYPPAHGGTAIVNGEAFDAMFFKNYGVNPFVDTEDDHLSTFAIDVDDASYVMTRSYLERGHLPPDEAVRVEEFVNHFDYGYDPPHSRPFEVYFEGSPSRFGQNCYLLRIGIKGLEVAPENRKPANLIFVVDVSGSMGREDRLGLVRKALRMLVDELRDDDRVGIVVYGSQGREIIQPTSIKRREKILDAIEWLRPSGFTNAEEGLRLGYAMADRVFEPNKINRIILCSDGVANVGRTGPDEILKRIKKYADKGITLSAVGFGMGNFNDILMEKLGNKGNGHYAYVDDLAEARRIFVDNLTGNLQVIARDVKIQVDFDPAVVRSYRLLGYENRDVDDDKFRDDKEDGGEIGAGHSVTALYEIKFRDGVRKAIESDDPYPVIERKKKIGVVYIRHKHPDDFDVTENNFAITLNMLAPTFNSCSPQFRLAAAAAEFAEILRKSYWAKGSSLSDVKDVVSSVYADWDTDEVLELMHMVSKAAQIEETLADN